MSHRSSHGCCAATGAAAVVVAVVGLASVVPAGCRRQVPAAAPAERAGVHGEDTAAADAAPGRAATPSRLPEDPAAGRKAELEWRVHMEKEERDRQLNYDRRRLKEHRAVVRSLAAARVRYDRAATPAAVARAKVTTAAAEKPLRERIVAIDHWGVNSPLLAAYDALLDILGRAYPAARLAALRGDRGPQRALGIDIDQRMNKIARWLHDAAEAEDE